MIPNLRHALRALLQARAFTPLAIATLALGLGATTAVFSVFESLLLRPRPGIVEEAALADVGRSQEGAGFDNFSWPDYEDYRTQNTSFADLAALDLDVRVAGLAADGTAEKAHMQWVSPNYLAVLGTRVVQGRDFTRQTGPAPEIVISHRYWQRRFNSDPAVVGRAVLFNSAPVTIVGVTEPGFAGSSLLAADFWAPLPLIETLEPGNTLLRERAGSSVIGLGRLKPGVAISQAQAELSEIARRIEQAYPNSHKGRGAVVLPSSRFPGELRTIVTVATTALFALAGLSLLVVCANIASLQLARGAARRRELAVRSALGATRRRLMIQLLAENLLLFLLGGVAGSLIAVWLVDAFRALLPSLPLPLAIYPTVNPAVFAFCLGVALLVGLVFGLGPAFTSTRFDLLSTLRSNEQPAGGRLLSLRNLFLTIQLSLSLALLAAAGLLAKGLFQAARTNPGFDTRRVEFITVDFRTGGLQRAEWPAFADTLLARTRALPGVASAAWSTAVPLSDVGRSFGALWPAGLAQTDETTIRCDWNLVSPGYFGTLGISLLAGRDFAETDRANSPRVAIVNETFARRTWPGQEAVGQILVDEDGATITVVGLAHDAKYRSLGESARHHIYVPFAQTQHREMTLFLKTRDGISAIPSFRALLAELRPGLPIAHTQSLASFADASLLPYRVASAVAAGAGSLALILASMGVYGSTLYWAGQRTREFGVRMALGATRGQLIRLVLGGSFTVASVAIVIGLAASLGLGQLIGTFLFGVSGADPVVLLGASVFFLALVLLAAWLPARRAAKINPIDALRSE